jgi:hypothetical protein
MNASSKKKEFFFKNMAEHILFLLSTQSCGRRTVHYCAQTSVVAYREVIWDCSCDLGRSNLESYTESLYI